MLSPHLHDGASGIFSDLLRSVQMIKGEGCGKQRKATAPIQFLVKLQPWFLSLLWKTCRRQNCSLSSCGCSEGPALGQNTLMMMTRVEFFCDKCEMCLKVVGGNNYIFYVIYKWKMAVILSRILAIFLHFCEILNHGCANHDTEGKRFNSPIHAVTQQSLPTCSVVNYVLPPCTVNSCLCTSCAVGAPANASLCSEHVTQTSCWRRGQQ